ncbi:MAG: hypothetical protein HKM94_10865, partial [Halobacteria archaeon]|nr:hypothetical protein [Halobacteria archaeon]
MVRHGRQGLLPSGVKRPVRFILALPVPVGSLDTADDLYVGTGNAQCLGKGRDMRTPRLGVP